MKEGLRYLACSDLSVFDLFGMAIAAVLIGNILTKTLDFWWEAVKQRWRIENKKVDDMVTPPGVDPIDEEWGQIMSGSSVRRPSVPPNPPDPSVTPLPPYGSQESAS